MNSALLRDLYEILPPQRVKSRLIDRYAFASDASHFYMVPEAVVQPIDTEEIRSLFALSQRRKIPMTFRAGGTSLSGQAVTSGLLVDLSRYWRKVSAESAGARVRVEPGVIGAQVNAALKPFGRKMGPDPASITACMMGGILANNSSGMCCGVAQNAYHTLRYIRFILPDGLVYDTEKREDYTRFEHSSARIFEGLRALREKILLDRSLCERIRNKYRQKNTTGYGLNAFLDYEHPLDILSHLLVGSEGTLAFIAEAVLDTVPDLPFKLSGILWFASPEAACDAIFDLKNTGAEALELMDRASLRSVEHLPGVPPILKSLPERAAAILCEYQAESRAEAAEKLERATPLFQKLPLLETARFTADPDEQASYWKIRKGMYPTAASVRAKGTATMLEDLTFPVERLGQAIVDVQALFQKYGYENGIIFGHAKDGNLHFCISQSFSDEAEIRRFEAFNDELFALVIERYGGALKAEHGTGRAVAPYVEAEWGPEAYEIMCALKSLIDPDNLLNPDVIITKDANLHLRDLKIMPVVEEEVDKCVECGFCERRCPSRDYTLTPRQRIGLRRALKRLEAAGETHTRNDILQDYRHDGMDTCAVDGMCATDCPVQINTGELIKRLRRENHGERANKTALFLARNFKTVEKTLRFALRTGFFFNRIFGKNFMHGLTGAMRKAFPSFPLWPVYIAPPASIRRPAEAPPADAVYFITCISRLMGGDIPDKAEEACRAAGLQLYTPPDSEGLCCGQVFSSKGFSTSFAFSANRAVEKLWSITREGRLPLVLDVSSCTQTFRNCRGVLNPENQKRFDRLRIYDSVDFASEVLLPRLKFAQKKESVVFHPVCSTAKMGLLPHLKALGNACAEHTFIPENTGCCGMAGDRGFYYPELTHAASAAEAEEVKKHTFDGYYCSAQTCSSVFSEAVGKEYLSVFHLLTSAKPERLSEAP